MSEIIVDAMDNAGAWTALAADGLTPSTQLSVADESGLVRYGSDRRSVRINGQLNALNHVLRRSRTALDLSIFDELRFWFYSNRRADGATERPFFLELRLGSTALGVADPANPWYRFVPSAAVNSWELVRISLADLPLNIRGALTELQLRCVDASAAFDCVLDDLLAVRFELLADVDTALFNRLHQRLSLGGNPVPAFLAAAGATAPAPPYLRIMHHWVELAGEQSSSSRARGDFMANRYLLRPPTSAYYLHYQLEGVGSSRAEEAQLLAFLLRELPPYDQLIVNGSPLPLEWVALPPYNQDGRPQAERARLYFRVLTTQEQGALVSAVPPYNTIGLEVEPATPL